MQMQLAASRQMTSSQDQAACARCAGSSLRVTARREWDGRRCLLANSGGIPRHAPRQKRAPRFNNALHTYVHQSAQPSRSQDDGWWAPLVATNHMQSRWTSSCWKKPITTVHTPWTDSIVCWSIGWVPIFSTCIKDRSMPPNYSWLMHHYIGTCHRKFTIPRELRNKCFAKKHVMLRTSISTIFNQDKIQVEKHSRRKSRWCSG